MCILYVHVVYRGSGIKYQVQQRFTDHVTAPYIFKSLEEEDLQRADLREGVIFSGNAYSSGN